MRLTHICYLILIYVIIFSCDSLPERPDHIFNPLDPANPSYKGPVVYFDDVCPGDQETITTDQVTFKWYGNNDDMLFRYRLDAELWNEFSEVTEAFYEFLDDTLHHFYIQGQFKTGDTSKTVIRSFFVDAIMAPALYLSPKMVRIRNAEQFEIDVLVDVEDSFAGVNLYIEFDFASIRVTQIAFNNIFFEQNGGRLIWLTNNDYNESGLLNLNCAVVEGDPKDVTGSSRIARIYFQHISGTSSEINITDASQVRNSENINLEVNSLLGARVTVQ